MSLRFHVPVPGDRPAVSEAVFAAGAMENDAAFASLFLLREKYGTELCTEDRMLLRRYGRGVRADSFAEGKRDVAAVMLPVLDNLERAAEAAENSPDEALRNGVNLVLKQMNEVYRKLNVTPISRQGEKFDPNLENAVLQGTPEEGEPGTVCQVLQKGYRMGDRVLRHAMVKVVPE